MGIGFSSKIAKLEVCSKWKSVVKFPNNLESSIPLLFGCKDCVASRRFKI